MRKILINHPKRPRFLRRIRLLRPDCILRPVRLQRPRHARAVQKFAIRQDIRILLTQVRQHLVDIAAEQRIQRHQIDLVRPQGPALAEEQIGDALHQHRRLPAARDAVHQQRPRIRIADHLVLLPLDRRRNGLHLVGAALGQRCEQQRILDRDLRVKIRKEPISLQRELTAEL